MHSGIIKTQVKRVYMYKCLANSQISDQDGYQLIVTRKEDMENIRSWRNAQLDILRQQQPLTREEQENYFQSILLPSFEQQHPRQILFSFLHNQECIGYGGLTHIDWDSLRAEVSFLVNPERIQDPLLYNADFRHFLTLLCLIAFRDLNFHRLFTETFAFRKQHIDVLENFGFIREGVLRDHIYKREEWHHSIIHGLLIYEVAHA